MSMNSLEQAGSVVHPEAHALVSSLWAMHPPRLSALLSGLTCNAASFATVGGEALSVEATGDSIRIKISGVILKEVPDWFAEFGIKATGAINTVKAFRRAIADPKVKEIILDIDSPGGTVAGVQELADEIYTARDMGKTIRAEVSDLCASAAYWIASQAHVVSANAAGEVGSVGVYSVARDWSVMFEQAGIKTKVISSHELKGVGVLGAPITDTQLADLERNVLDFFELFTDAVQRGRGMSDEQVAVIATGQVWLAKEAIELGLIDEIRGVAVEVVSTEASITNPPSAVGAEMAENNLDNAALAAQRVKELEDKLAEVEKQKAASELARLNLLASQRNALVEKYGDRIPPSSRKAVEVLGESFGEDLAGFEAHLSQMPVFMHSERVSQPVVTPEDYRANEPSAGVAQLTKHLGVSVQKHEDYAILGDKVKSVESNGDVTLYDGRRMSKQEMVKALGLKTITALTALLVLGLFQSSAFATALTTSRKTECKGSGYTHACRMTASQTVYAGGLVMETAEGTCQAAAASASNHGVIGVAQETKTAPASGAAWLKVTDNVICKFAGATIEQEDVGQVMWCTDDQSFDETVASNLPICGILVRYDSASVGWIYLNRLVSEGRINSITDPLTLTQNLTLSNGEIIDNATDDGSILLTGAGGTNNESIEFDLETTANEVGIQTATGVTRVDFGTIGVKTDTPLFLLNKVRFCGNGANATTAWYAGPTVDHNATDYTLGGTACDGNDSATEGTADAVVDALDSIKVVGMQCGIEAGGADDVYTFTLRDDTATVTGVTCSVTLDGSNAKACSVLLDAPVTVAVGSTMAVMQAAATDDDMSAKAMECTVFYTY